MPALAYTYTAHCAAGEHELAARLLDSLPVEEQPDLIRCLAMQTRLQIGLWPSPAATRIIAAGISCEHPACMVTRDILAGRPVGLTVTPEQIRSIADSLAYIACDSAAAQGIDGPAYAMIVRKTISSVYQMAGAPQ